MRLHRFYVEQKIGEAGEITLADSELIHQMVSVFRFHIGNKVSLFDGTGFEYEVEIILINKKEVKLNILKALKKNSENNMKQNKNVSLYLALIKKGNFELAAEKCTEVGVSEIHPIISERSEKKDLNIERLNKIVKEASEQSGRVTLPEVFNITDLEKAVTQAVAEGRVCVTFHTDADASTAPSPFNRPLASHHIPSQTQDSSLEKEEIDGRHQVATFIGPEGGWTEAEMELFRKNNFKILSLGSNILRAETAAMIAAWKILNS